MKDRHFCTGSFTYILTAQWDVVSPKMIKRYQVNPFSCGMNERVNMKEAIRLILQEDKWTPYESVQDIADFYNAQEPFPFMEEEKRATARCIRSICTLIKMCAS